MKLSVRALRLGILMAVALLLFMALPAELRAQPAAAPANNCGNFVGVTNHIAGCVRQSIDEAAARFFAEIYPALRNAILAAITLAIILYGVLMAYGMVESFGRDSSILLFKVVAVIWLTANSPLLYQWATQSMDSVAATVVNYTPPNGPAYQGNGDGDFSQAECIQRMRTQQANSAPNLPVVGPWLGMDCLLDSVIGIKTTNAAAAQQWYNDTLGGTADRKGLSRGYLFLFFSGAQSSVMGAVLAIIGAVFIWGLLSLVIKAFFMYIAAVIGLALMIILSPLFIPLLLFRVTKTYFDKWFKVTLSFALQPIIALVFIVFSLAAVDFAAFSGDYSIMYRIAGTAVRADKFDMNEYLKETYRTPDGAPTGPNEDALNQPIIYDHDRDYLYNKAASVTRAEVVEEADGGVFNKAKETFCTPDRIAADASGTLREICNFYYSYKVPVQKIDWEKMARARNPAVALSGDSTSPGQQIAREIIASALFCALLVFVLNGLLAVVPMIAYDLMGDYGQSANLGSVANFGGRGQNTLMSAQRFGTNVTNNVKGLVGIR